MSAVESARRVLYVIYHAAIRSMQHAQLVSPVLQVASIATIIVK